MKITTKEQKLAKRETKSPSELQDASWHVYYEAKMLQYCGHMLIHCPPDDGLHFAALMNSFLIHARNLDHFFHGLDRSVQSDKGGGVRLDDIIEEDFFTPSAPRQKPTENQLTKQEITDINKQLAHLTYYRTKKQRDSYPFDNIRMRLMKMVERFIKDAPSSNLHPSLQNFSPIHPYPIRL